MSVNYHTLDLLRQNHPAWRLLRSDNAPLVAAFLQRVFITPNLRVMAQADLAEALEDELFALRQRLGAESFPKAALDFLQIENGSTWWLIEKLEIPPADPVHFAVADGDGIVIEIPECAPLTACYFQWFRVASPSSNP